MNTTCGKGKASSGAAAEASRRVVADSTWLALQRIVKEGGGASRSHCLPHIQTTWNFVGRFAKLVFI